VKKIIDELNNVKTIGIGGHIHPDGDCVGSTMALYLYLKKVMPQAEVKVYLETPADIFRVIKDFDEIQNEIDINNPPEVFIALDCSKDRLGFSEPFFDKAIKSMNIDHHISNGGNGDVTYIVTNASSTSELIYDLIDDSQLDTDIAQALYIGILHDTGVFQYSNTSPKTLRTVARLLEFNFDFTKIIDETFYEKTYLQSQILGRALLESILILDGKCIVSSVDLKNMAFYGVNSKDLDGIVNQLRIIKGVDCAVFMYQTGNMEYKVSMRSNEKVNVSRIATYFGGGGHKKAAGCTMNGTFHDVINNLSLHIESEIISNYQENQLNS